ncbi:hypothetical protein BJX63DRAFT_442687 [Aspergillus granulosus]|uniref:Uncharacterized protein n=1 Tax=Aspergillus granulosus TaxID=176169 RepID=A0ABR4HEY3_9EURO
MSALHLYDLAMVHGLGGEGNAALSKLWSTPSPLTSGTWEPTRYKTISKTEALQSLPGFAHTTANLIDQIQAHDDPTGTQTCHDINALTMWDVDSLVTEFQSKSNGFFILTNSRALPPAEARKLVSNILRKVSEAATIAEQKFEVVLRGDSTLRGHFLEEIESHISAIGSPNAWIFAPFFEQGGRFTIDDVHYVAENNTLIPVADTPFATDRTFGYKSSNLRDYVLEKAGNSFTHRDIVSVTLKDIRQGGPEAIAAKLITAPKGGIVIMNAVKEEDMLLFCLALLDVQKKHNLRFGYRTGASFVSSRLGIPPKDPIEARQLAMPDIAMHTGGLIVVGSYVPKSSRQLETLIRRRGSELEVLTVDVPALLAEAGSQPDIQTTLQNSANMQRIVAQTSASLQSGKDVLVMTSRELMTTDSLATDAPAAVKHLTNLDINTLVASSLVHILRSLKICPRYLLAKGGVTSSDAATAGVGIKRGRVLGQAAPGVPIWWCEDDGDSKTVEEGGRRMKWTRLPLIVFPGNVGDEDTLADVVEKWAA